MKTAIKFLFPLICIAFISGFSASALAANKPNYTVTIPYQLDGATGEFHNGLAVMENGGKPEPDYIIPPDDWAKPEIDRAIAEGLIPEDMCRKYQDNITRADFCRLAINLIEKETGMKIDAFIGTRGMSGRVSDPIAFTDTDDPVIITASRLGIVNGAGSNKFDPTGTIKRQDAAVMLHRTAKLIDYYIKPNTTLEVFADRDKFSGYAVAAIDFVSALADKGGNNKVMGSIGNNNFSPLDTFTRQQAYISILRLYNYTLRG